MAAGAALLCSTLLFAHVFVSSGQTCVSPSMLRAAVQRFMTHSILRAADPKFITAESGQDVTLTCRAPNNNNRVVEWKRAHLWFDYDDFDSCLMHSFSENWEDLQNGDVSLILKDVTIHKAGTYMCRVRVEEQHSWTISIIHLHVDPPDQKTITAESGQDVTLTCRDPNNKFNIVKWSKDDLGDKYVLLYWDRYFVPDDQHPSFKNRVDLQDRQMKDGDVSLILKDVTINDAGTYMCHVLKETRSRISFIHLVVVPPELKIIPVESGQDVTLTCRAPNNNITVVNWSRADLGDVFLYQDGHFVPANQHPSFKNRVDLHDSQMKDGDVSLILKDVTINDTGIYECRVSQNSDESPKLRSRISLRVADKTITVESGQDVTLTCRAPNNKITAVEWSRDDLGDENVLFYRNGTFVPDNQHRSFKSRVDLQDRQMKDGDVSLILKDVKINETETYKCRAFMTETSSWNNNTFIRLCVVPPIDQKNITAESGQDVTLTCRASNNITVVKWSRADLGDEYVFVHKDGHFVPDEQHPSFKNRVDLLDRQMKDGDVSLILKDVKINDAGTYECRVLMNDNCSQKNISIIYLHVVPPGRTRRCIALIVVILLLLVGVGFLSYRNHKVSRYSYEVPTENNEAPQSPQQDCVRGQTEVNYPEPPADGH